MVEEMTDREWKDRVLREFKEVFLFPLISGIMFGVGSVAGRRLADGYFSKYSQRVAAPVIVTE